MTKASPAVKITLFSVAILAAFALGFKLGHSVLSQHSVAGLNRTSKQYRSDHAKIHSEMMNGQPDGMHHSMKGMEDAASEKMLGLSATDNSGLQLHLEKNSFRAPGKVVISFQIRSQDGKAIRSYNVEHQKKMHLIIARKDLSLFYHLHPTIDEHGRWKASLQLKQPGNYRLFADFVTAGKKHVLATDFSAAGNARYTKLPKPAQTVRLANEYTVRLRDDSLHDKSPTSLKFDIQRAGKHIVPQMFLGAGGHLVALRSPDLAYLHTHPLSDGETSDGHGPKNGMKKPRRDGMSKDGHNHSTVDSQAQKGKSAPETFQLTFPSAARYRLFFQFKVDGRIYTAPFTVAVEE